MLTTFLILGITVVCAVPQQQVQLRNSEKSEADCLRLPRYATPSAYKLELRPNFDYDYFDATVYIEVQTDMYGLSDDISTFVLHAEELSITHANVVPQPEPTLPFETMIKNAQNTYREKSQQPFYDPNTHFLTLDVGSPLQTATYLLTFEYIGQIRDDVVGFYKSTYAKGTENERAMFTTQFQPTHARKAFPCFDEPFFKANFTVAITIPSGYDSYTALSNMPVQNLVTRDNGEREWIFYPSMPMSSYLVAWVVSDLSSKDDGRQEEDGIAIRAWAPPDSLDHTQYCLEITRPALYALQNYTGIQYKYPHHVPRVLDKIDQVVVPDFMFGAMENWGLITYRDTALLFNDGAALARQTVLSYVTHELAHMWFGNLVTTQRWDYAWLNEAFAQFFELYIAGNAVEEDWQLRKSFIASELHAALELDGWSAARPLTRQVCTPEDASEAFELLTYVKGASILRMINYVLGPENFQKAIKSYLTKYAFRSVTPEELYSEMANFAHVVGLSRYDISQFIRSWTDESGYPFIFVIRNYATGSATVQKYSFNYLRPGFYSTHYVPLTWTFQGKGFDIDRPQLFLNDQQSATTIQEMPEQDKWVIFNVQQTGYYRVMYDITNFELLANYLKNEANDLDSIHVINRAQLIDDLFAFGRTGQLDYGIILNTIDYLRREKAYLPWTTAFSGFSFLNRILSQIEEYPLFQKYVLNLLTHLYAYFNFYVPENHVDKLLFNEVLTWACTMGNVHCTQSAVKHLQSFLHESQIVPGDLRSVVYCYGIQNSHDENWELLWNHYMVVQDETERRLILKGLSCSRNIDRLKQLLEYSIDDKYIWKQERPYVYLEVSSNPQGSEIAFEFLLENHENVRESYGSLSRVITGIAKYLTTQEHYNKLKIVVDDHVDDLGNSGDTAMETVLTNIAWMEVKLPELLGTLEVKTLHRLPKTVLPEQYNLHLEPDLETDTFIGSVEILVAVSETTNDVFLHLQDLNLSEEGVQITQHEHSAVSNEGTSMSESILLRNIEKYPNFELVRLILQTPLQCGMKYTIKIEYSGNIRDDMVGFYKTFYKDNQWISRKIVATKFAPTHARKAFPCFDEPSFKARFQLTVVIPASHPTYHCLGNADILRQTTLENNAREIVFMNTPKMSTYIVAWVISDLEENKDALSETVTFSTWTRGIASTWSSYSLEVSRKMLEHLEKYTDYKYTDESDEFPLTKIDQVATPDFVSGAMENWGLITYRETALLYNDGTAAARKRVASVIAHELAHMWFGNLVTTAWWESTWLNEGFANYFQHLITSKVEVLWNMMDQFVVDHLQYALQLDAVASARSLTYPVFTPADAVASFGSLTYSKGGSFLRMLNFIIGADNFEKAIQNYVKSNVYDSATPEDFFAELLPFSNEAGLEPSEFLDLLVSWTEQSGYPLVHVERHYDGSGRVTISQERFLSRPDEAASPFRYSVPLSWVEEDGIFDSPKLGGFLHSGEDSKTFEGFKDNGWIVFNTQQIGYFRVSYDAENWERMVAYLKRPRFDAMHYLNRAQLLDDAFALALTGRLPFARLVALTAYLHQENDYTPWAAALAGFAELDRLLHGHRHYGYFQNYISHLIEEIYPSFAYTEKQWHTEKLLVSALTSRACAVGHANCTEHAAELLHFFVMNKERVSPDVRNAVYCHGIRHYSLYNPNVDEEEIWEYMWDEFYDSHDEAERALLLNGLGCSTNVNNLRKLLKRTVEGTGPRKQEGVSAFSAVYASPIGVQVVLDFLRDHLEETRTFLGSLSNVLSGLGNRIVNEVQRNQFADIVETHALGSSGTSAVMAIDRNLKWIDQQADELMKEIMEYLGVTPEPTTLSPSTINPPTSEPTTSEPPTTGPPTPEPPTQEPPTPEPPTQEPPTSEPPTQEPPTSEPTTPGRASFSSLDICLIAIYLVAFIAL